MKNNKLNFFSRFIILAVFVVLLVIPAAAASITCSKTSLRFGDSVQMRTSGLTGTVTWSSSNPNLATISSSGLVKVVANQDGTVRFTASAGNGTVTKMLTVKRLTLNWSSYNLTVGNKVTLKLNNADHKPAWSTGNYAVAAFVSDSFTNDGEATVIAKKAGTAVITASFNGNKFACQITVKSSGSSSGKTTPTKPSKKKESKPKYTVKASDTNVNIQTAGYVDITANGEKNIAINCNTNIVTCKLGEWGQDGDNNTARIYLTGVSDGTTTVRIANNATNAYTTVNVTVKGMGLSAAKRRANLGKIILSKGGKIKRSGTKNGYRYTSYISYNKAKKTYFFRVMLKNDEVKCVLKLSTDKKFASGTITTSFILLKSNRRFKTMAKIAPKKYTYRKNIKFTTKKNPGKVSAKQMKSLSNSMKNMALEVWDRLLIEGYTYNLNGLGFSEYEAG